MSNKVKIGCWVGAALLVGVMVGAGFMFFTKEEDPWLTAAKEATEREPPPYRPNVVTGLDLYKQWVREGQKTNPLSGLKEVKVVVANIDEQDERKWGLSKSTLQTSVELKLRQAGIKVTESADAILGVSVFIGKSRKETELTSLWEAYTLWAAYTSSAGLFQTVYLARNCSIRCGGATWHSPITVEYTDKVGENIRSTVSDQIDEFLNAYLEANPKKPKDNQKQ